MTVWYFEKTDTILIADCSAGIYYDPDTDTWMNMFYRLVPEIYGWIYIGEFD